MNRIDAREGRSLFGLDPVAYDKTRPDYPESTYAAMQNLVIFPGAVTLEIGPGNGLDPETRVSKIADCLKSSGFVALTWNVFQDLNKLCTDLVLESARKR